MLNHLSHGNHRNRVLGFCPVALPSFLPFLFAILSLALAANLHIGASKDRIYRDIPQTGYSMKKTILKDWAWLGFLFTVFGQPHDRPKWSSGKSAAALPKKQPHWGPSAACYKTCGTWQRQWPNLFIFSTSATNNSSDSNNIIFTSLHWRPAFLHSSSAFHTFSCRALPHSATCHTFQAIFPKWPLQPLHQLHMGTSPASTKGD